MKLPVMKFDLNNDTIVDAIKAAVEAGGISLNGKHVRIEFRTKRKGPDAGLSATVEVSSDPFLESTDDTVGKSVSAGATAKETPAVAKETAEVATETAATTSKKGAAKQKPDLFDAE